MKKIMTIMALAIVLIGLRSQAQQSIAQPYYGDGKIRFYNKTNAVGSSPCYTLDLTADINTNWGTTYGINGVIIYQDKLFVSIAASDSTGGVLVYNYADVYPAKTAGPVSVIYPEGATGLGVSAMAIQPSTGDLFVGGSFSYRVSNTSYDGGIYVYTAASGYANSSGTQLASYFNDQSIVAVIADLAFDASGNLWFTEFTGGNLPTDDYLVCYKAAVKSNNYIICNPVNMNYAANSLSGGATTPVYLLSGPEGLAFDPSGNLWIGNNNDVEDGVNCNGPLDGTLAEISASWITGTLFASTAGSGNFDSVPPASATVELISGSKPGGLLFDGNTIYVNDQGTNQGISYTSNGDVWKWDVTTAFNSTNFAATGIHTTYPGNGLMALDNSQFSVATDCALGVTNVTESAEVSLYPNPANDKLYINASAAATLSIYNVIGEQMLITSYDNQTIEANTSAFEAGVYIAQLKFADGSYTTKKFVKE